MTEKEKVLLSKLSWNASDEDQQKAMREIVDNTKINPQLLIQPIDKSHWSNAAKVLETMGFDRVKSVTYELLVWLQDSNWPGTETIIELLHTFPNQYMMPFYEKAIMQALSTNDETWLEGLQTFIHTKKIKTDDFTNKILYDKIEKFEDQWIS